jgi:hypothetical protein
MAVYRHLHMRTWDNTEFHLPYLLIVETDKRQLTLAQTYPVQMDIGPPVPAAAADARRTVLLCRIGQDGPSDSSETPCRSFRCSYLSNTGTHVCHVWCFIKQSLERVRGRMDKSGFLADHSLIGMSQIQR